MALLRIHGLDSLNAAPLQWRLRDGASVDGTRLRVTLGPPSAAAAALADGRVDVALLPTIELQRIPDLQIVPGICVAARRRVSSVLLLSRRNPALLDEVAVDRTSRTSVALLRVLLRHCFDVSPRFVAAPPDARRMMAGHDAALVIADAALRADAELRADAALRPDEPDVQVHDLAELWSSWTGLPFVFAAWAARPGVDLARVTRLLDASRSEGLQNIPRLVAQHATLDGFPGGPALTAYLCELLHYNLGPEEEASLQRFFTEAHAAEVIPEPRPLFHAEPAARTGRALAGGQS